MKINIIKNSISWYYQIFESFFKYIFIFLQNLLKMKFLNFIKKLIYHNKLLFILLAYFKDRDDFFVNTLMLFLAYIGWAEGKLT